MRRARQGVDAILPGGYASSQWSDEELVDLANEAYESMQREFRLVRRKWNMVTLNSDSAAFTREDETYTPSTSLVLGTSGEVTLPPDFAELVRIICTSNTSIRFMPAEIEGEHWQDTEQSYVDNTGNLLAGEPAGQVFYYDIVGNRTLRVIPVVSTSFDLEIDYIPMLRPLTYTNQGMVSITNADTAITGSMTSFTDVYSAASGQRAEIIVGASDPQSNQISVVRDYQSVSTIASTTSATLASAFSGTTVTSVPYILSMAPTFPREYHRWMARLTSSLMLSKVNPDISEKYFTKFMQQFKEQINPVIRRRQSQASQVVEDADEFGMSDF
jgi:hypothetical protein